MVSGSKSKEEKRQDAVYNAIVAYAIRKNYAPTRRELASATNLSGWEVSNTLKALQARGLICITPKTPRAISLVGYAFVKRV
ncbi:MAG: hypothetical protein K2I47_06320 [Odoribacter sp.]|nr:hypothetical protein [Odoribacter sp.]